MSVFAIGQDLTNFLKVPDHPAKILNVETVGDEEIVTYEFSIDVNIDKAKAALLTGLKFDLMPRTERNAPKPQDFIRTNNPLDYIKGMESYARALRRFKQEVEASIFAKTSYSLHPPYSQALRAMDPPKPTKLKALNDAFDLNDTNKFVDSRRKKVRTKMPFESVGRYIAPVKDEDKKPRKNTSKKKGTKLEKYNPKVSQGAGIGVGKPQSERKVFREVLRAGVDPGQIRVKTKGPKIGDLVRQPSLLDAISKTVYSPPAAAPEAVNYLFRPIWKKVVVRVKVSKSILDDFTYFVLRVRIGKKGVASQSVKIPVNHARIINAYLTPDLPPELTAAYSSRGNISVSVTQKDPKSTRVKVFRRTHPLSSATTLTGSPWELVLDTALDPKQKTTFRDRIAYFGQVMYRALSYGPNGKPGEEFASKIVRPISRGRITTALTANASFKEQRQGSPIIIRVTDIPPSDDVSMVRLQRYDVTYDSRRLKRQNKDRGFTYVESSKSAVGRTEVTFEDRNVRSGRVYEYLPVGTSPTEGTIYGASYFINVPVFTSEPMISMNLTAPVRVPRSRNEFEVQMELEADFTEFGFNKIRETLASKGQDQLYQDQIEKNRSEFGKLISFVVERENLKTGDVESFGVVEPGTFVDDAETRTKRGISEPEAATEYNYSVTALINKADNMFPKVAEKSIDPGTLNIVTQTLSKLTSPLTKQKGVIPSTARQFDLKAIDKVFPVDPRQSSLTNVQKKFPFMFAPPTNTVKDLKVEEMADYNVISWVFDGPLKDIDHFRIELTSGGGFVIIDTVHCAPGTSRFFYRHKDIGYALNYQYRITPVNLSFSSVTSIKSGIIAASVAGVRQEISMGAERLLATKGLPEFSFPQDLGAKKVF